MIERTDNKVTLNLTGPFLIWSVTFGVLALMFWSKTLLIIAIFPWVFMIVLIAVVFALSMAIMAGAYWAGKPITFTNERKGTKKVFQRKQ